MSPADPTTATHTISLSWELPHPPRKVWRALTDPALIARWLMETDLQATVGHRFTFRQDPTPWWDGIVHSEVLELEPERRLRYTWRSGPASSPLDTVVTWSLTPIGPAGTRLTLEHAGFTPAARFASEGARKGWERMVSEGLAATLAQLA